jgi:NAD(P) transhydrogenase subunit alpha
VAATADTVARLTEAGLSVGVESGAGVAAFQDDDSLRAAGAEVVADPLAGADAVLSVGPLSPADYARLSPGALAISFLPLPGSSAAIAAARDAQVTLMAMERLPRISRAQSMDALTSQALVAGYRAGLVAAELSPRFFPLLMTAAGTMQAARALVLGAGVAGLQAIATAKRLGARVRAYDVRPDSADEVRSMGATFLDLGLDSLAGTGGYAREMTAERAAAQQQALAPHVAASDVLITTAAVPNRPAPLLVTTAMLEQMPPGAVVVDLAAESGGNVEGSVAGEIVTIGPARVWGGLNVPAQMPDHASRLYARNVTDLLLLTVSEGTVQLDFDDEIVDSVAVTHAGQVRHPDVEAFL